MVKVNLNNGMAIYSHGRLKQWYGDGEGQLKQWHGYSNGQLKQWYGLVRAN